MVFVTSPRSTVTLLLSTAGAMALAAGVAARRDSERADASVGLVGVSRGLAGATDVAGAGSGAGSGAAEGSKGL